MTSTVAFFTSLQFLCHHGCKDGLVCKRSRRPGPSGGRHHHVRKRFKCVPPPAPTQEPGSGDFYFQAVQNAQGTLKIEQFCDFCSRDVVLLNEIFVNIVPPVIKAIRGVQREPCVGVELNSTLNYFAPPEPIKFLPLLIFSCVFARIFK